MFMQHSWVLYCSVNKDISLLDFRRSVVQYYLKGYRSLPDHPLNRFSTKESYTDSCVSDSSRLNSYMHLVKATSGDQKRRCADVDACHEFEPNVEVQFGSMKRLLCSFLRTVK